MMVFIIQVCGCLCYQSKGLVISCKEMIRQQNLLLRHMVSPDISTFTLRYQDNTKMQSTGFVLLLEIRAAGSLHIP